jgi:hypothetical protein
METQIANALQNLEPGAFQHLVEDWAEISWPDRYRSLVPQGRTAFNATRAGWPDAWASSGERIHVLEVTHAKDWETHLEADITKAEGSPSRVASFAFVSIAAEPTEKQLAPYVERLINCGVDESQIDLVFGDRLRRSLCSPRFARIRSAHLGLPATVAPFAAIEHVGNLFGRDDLQAFRPSLLELTSGRVHRPSAASKVEQILASSRLALLRGRAAAGKTVLACDIALSWASANRPAYYLDCARIGIDQHRHEIERVMVTWGDDDVLFVCDNVHLHAAAAEELAHTWRQIANGSRLLLVARSGIAGAIGAGAPFADLAAARVELTPTTNDVRGVYRRLAGRRRGTREDEPPASAVRSWTNLFAGDLIALSAALADRLATDWSDWRLTAEHATAYVSDQYLQAVDAAARPELLKLALCSWAELPCTAAAADPRKLAPLIKDGMIVRDHDGRMSLLHAGVGELVLAAAGARPPAPGIAGQVGSSDPVLGIALALLLYERHRTASGAAALAAFQKDNGAAILSHLAELPQVAKLLEQVGVSPNSLDGVLADRSLWARPLAELSVGAFAALAQYTRAKLPQSFAIVSEYFESEAPSFPHFTGAAMDLKELGLLPAAVQRCWPQHGQALDHALANSESLAAAGTGLTVQTFIPAHSRALRRLAEHAPLTAVAIDRTFEDEAAWANVAAASKPEAVARMCAIPAPPMRKMRTLLQAATDTGYPERWLDGYFWHGHGRLRDLLADFSQNFPHHTAALQAALIDPDRVERWDERVRSRGLGVIGRLAPAHADDLIAPLFRAVLGGVVPHRSREDLIAEVATTQVIDLAALLGGLAELQKVDQPRLAPLFDVDVLAPARTQILTMTAGDLLGTYNACKTGVIALASAITDDEWRDSGVVGQPESAVRHFWPLLAFAETVRAANLPGCVAEAIVVGLSSGEVPPSAVALDVAVAILTRAEREGRPRAAAIAALTANPEWPESGLSHMRGRFRPGVVLQALLKEPSLLRSWRPKEVHVALDGSDEAVVSALMWGALSTRSELKLVLDQTVVPSEAEVERLMRQIEALAPDRPSTLSYGQMASALTVRDLHQARPTVKPSTDWAERLLLCADPAGIASAPQPVVLELRDWLARVSTSG